MNAVVGTNWGARMVRAMPFLWLAVLFLSPFAIVAKISLSDAVTAQPPYSPVWQGWASLRDFLAALDLENFQLLLSDDLYVSAFLGSLRIAAIATLILLLIGYPMAYAMARAPRRWRGLLLMLIVLPFWTSFLIRIYAWIGILKPEGLLNAALLWLGLVDAPLQFLDNQAGIFIGLTYAYLPFMVLPLYAALEKQDPALVEAALDLGCPPLQAFWRITVPLSWPGIVAGALLCFIPMVGEFVVPDLLGGADTLMIGKTLWSEFFGNRDWPLASAVAILLLIILVGPILVLRAVEARELERA
jgi:putrescine transport system permease protein